jgi:glutamyl-tRNA synthetase
VTPRGRYAPSPTGDLHLGNASTALLSWLSVRARGGAYVLRLEDLDQPRVQPGAAERCLADLRWLGLDWDEGPDRGGPHAPYSQWARRERYAAAFERLRDAGHLYPCFCSRKDIAAAASAPQAPGDEVLYPGTCRSLSPREVNARVARGAAHAWRFRVPAGAVLVFDDGIRGRYGEGQPPPGDFVVRRADGVPAYQLAVVVDDAAMEITEVVRGDDLLASTARQILLYRALDLPIPAFAHAPLLLGADGVRLSKRHAGTSIAERRAAGETPERVVGCLAALLGVTPDPAPRPAASLIAGFSLAAVRQAPEGLCVAPPNGDAAGR